MARKSILVVDDDKPQRDILHDILSEAGYDVTLAASGEAALKFAKERSFDLALTDLKMTGMDGIELLQHLLTMDKSIVVILLTAHGTIDSAKEALRRGAFDYLQKPFDRDALLATIKRALGTLDQIDVEILSASPKMEAVKKMILKVARSSSTVLIRGESGTGKELIARAIHNQSPRASEMFQAVNCAAINENLLESELFGHEKGAFTGAHADKEGLVQHAAGGSLMLDEIAEMPVELQPKLLRVLQERTCRKIGSEKSYPVDFRLICSTNRLPADAIRDGLLRDDLFYRISTITIHVPPLRERMEDIQLLTDHFFKLYSEKYDRPVHGVSQSAYQRLFSHAWPGNVRELQNVIERAVLLAKGDRIEPADLPFDNGGASSATSPVMAWDVPPNMTLEDIEKFVIERALQRTGGNKQKAANMLGIYRPRLYSKIKKYKIGMETVAAN